MFLTVLGKELATYEEMIKVEPQQGRPRPIMLIGMSDSCDIAVQQWSLRLCAAPRNGPFTIEELKHKLTTGDTAGQFGSPIPRE